MPPGTYRLIRRWIGGLSVALIVTLGLVIFNVMRTTGDERNTCRIQARGLPAGHVLANVIIDLHDILTLPPSPQARKQPPLSPAAKAVIDRLTHDSALYGRLESKQPQTRSC